MLFYKKKGFKNKKNILLFFGIIWIMINLISFRSDAKTVFSKVKPNGVMATAVGEKIAISWEPVKGAEGYQIYEALEDGTYTIVKQTKSCQSVLTDKEPGTEYFYYVRAYGNKSNGKRVYGKASKKVSTTVAEEGTSTIKNFLKTAIAPIGSTMYVWGGGWNKADTGAGSSAKRIGLSPKWRTFAKKKTAAYNYRNYRYQIHDGLDCSGYVGWCVYNVLHTKKNQTGYVYSASYQAKKFSELGFGSYQAGDITDYQAGDIMSSTCKCCGHVWIVVGACKDGSVVLVHSSPSGVQLCGTTTPSGKKNSKAYRLARKYMKKYYNTWYKKYPDVSRGASYLSHYGQMRWQTTGNGVVLSDPDGYQTMSAEEILKDLFK